MRLAGCRYRVRNTAAAYVRNSQSTSTRAGELPPPGTRPRTPPTAGSEFNNLLDGKRQVHRQGSLRQHPGICATNVSTEYIYGLLIISSRVCAKPSRIGEGGPQAGCLCRIGAVVAVASSRKCRVR
jgi:hypothetical protein